mgnify:CR=1 FL=1
MTTRRDFLKTMSLASAGLALGSGELLNAQTISSKKGRNEKVKISLYWHWKPWRANYTGFCTYGYGRGCGSV